MIAHIYTCFAPDVQRQIVLAHVRAELDAVNVDLLSGHDQRAVEGLATLATINMRFDHGAIYRALAAGLAVGDGQAGALCQRWFALEGEIDLRGLRCLARVPLYPHGGVALLALWVVLFTPLLAGAALLNLPVLAVAYGVARGRDEATDAIILRRVKSGVLAAVVWWLALALLALAVLGVTVGALALLVAIFVTLSGLRCWWHWRVATVACSNLLIAPDLWPMVRDLRAATLHWYSNQ